MVVILEGIPCKESNPVHPLNIPSDNSEPPKPTKLVKAVHPAKTYGPKVMEFVVSAPKDANDTMPSKEDNPVQPEKHPLLNSMMEWFNSPIPLSAEHPEKQKGGSSVTKEGILATEERDTQLEKQPSPKPDTISGSPSKELNIVQFAKHSFPKYPHLLHFKPALLVYCSPCRDFKTVLPLKQ